MDTNDSSDKRNGGIGYYVASIVYRGIDCDIVGGELDGKYLSKGGIVELYPLFAFSTSISLFFCLLRFTK